MKSLKVKLVAKREVLDDTIFVRGMHDGGFAEAAQAVRVLGLGQMAAAGAIAQHLAGGGDLKPLGHRLFRFDAFGTSHKFNSKERALYAPVATKQGKIENKLVVLRAGYGVEGVAPGRL
jgi:hypothetical protein